MTLLLSTSHEKTSLQKPRLPLNTSRDDIFCKHHLCRIITTRVKFHFVNVLLEQFMYVSFCFLVPVTNDKVSNEPARTKLGYHSSFRIGNDKFSYQMTIGLHIFFGWISKYWKICLCKRFDKYHVWLVIEPMSLLLTYKVGSNLQPNVHLLVVWLRINPLGEWGHLELKDKDNLAGL